MLLDLAFGEDIMLGRTLGHYRIFEHLGEGAMGVVWRAEDTKLGRHVAIKLLPDEFAADEDRLSRFRNEATVLAAINHSNIATLYGMEEADGRHLLVMEYVRGESLDQRIARGAIPVDEASPSPTRSPAASRSLTSRASFTGT